MLTLTTDLLFLVNSLEMPSDTPSDEHYLSSGAPQTIKIHHHIEPINMTNKTVLQVCKQQQNSMGF